MLIFHAMSLCMIFKGISSFLNQDETQISFDLIKELKIRQCVLAGNHDNLISVIKKFSSENIPIVYINYTGLANYINSTEKGYFPKGLILKDENLFAVEEISRLFERANQSHKLQNFAWLTFVGTQTLEIEKLVIPFDSEFIIIQSTNRTSYRLTEIYTLKNRLFSIEFGTWDDDFGLKAPNAGFYTRRLNFQKTEIRVLSSVEVTDGRHMSQDVSIVQGAEIIDGFVYMMNLTYLFDIERSYDDLKEKLAKIGDISGITIIFNFDYDSSDKMGPFSKKIINWYIKYPKTELRSDYYLQPFDNYLWSTLLSVILLGTVLILITQILIQNKKRFLIDDLFLGLESFCNQCGSSDVENVRFICILLRLAAVILMGQYGAVITSFFAVETFQPPFENLETFLDNGDYRFLVTKGLDYSQLFMKMYNNENYKEMHENFTKYISVNDAEDLYGELCYGKYAEWVFPDLARHYIWPCSIYKIPENLGSFWYGFILKEHNPFTKIFNENLVRFCENGFQMRFRMMENEYNPKVIAEDPFQPIKVEQMTQVLSIPFIGILLGIVIIIMEMINKRLHSQGI